MVTVISLGGSIVAPEGADGAFLKDFAGLVGELLDEDKERQFIFVVGGGGPARLWQNAYRTVCADSFKDEEADWIGIMATRLNAQLVKAVMAPWCRQQVVTDPTVCEAFFGRVLVAAGWKPGFSSDNDAVLLAGRFKAKTVINLSNIEKVYTGDPKKDPNAMPLDNISWEDFRAMVGDKWVPGTNVPFDPIASRHAQELGLKVICAAGRNLENLRNIIRGKDFTGTTIG